MSKGYSKRKLEILNECRVYLQVTTLSDITSGNGHYLLDHIFQRNNPLQSYSSLSWPCQGIPNERSWTIWNLALRQCFPTNWMRRLVDPLGQWHTIDTQWGSFFNMAAAKLYVKDEQWMQFTPNTQNFSGNNTQYLFEQYREPPNNCSHIAVAWFAANRNLQT